MPTALIHANVFGASHVGVARIGERRRKLELAQSDGYRLVFRGSTLTQAHADLLGVALRHASGGVEGDRFKMPVEDLLRELGRHHGQLKREGLEGLVHDLACCTLAVRSPGRAWAASALCVSRFGVDEADAMYFGVDRPLLALLGLGVAELDEEQRHALGNRPLAQWMQMYLEIAHGRPPLTVTHVRERVAAAQPLFGVRRRVKAAARELSAVGGRRVSVSATDEIVED